MTREEAKAAQAKLEEYWSLLGFKSWATGASGRLYLGMWTGYVLPRIEDVCPHLFES